MSRNSPNATPRGCKDCGAGSKRPEPYPGPRCATHHRAVTKARKAAAHEQSVRRIYGLEEGEYWLIYELQGGRCAICQRATGRTKRLAVDHDHITGMVRGLLCSICNRMLGAMHDNPDVFYRAAEYLERSQRIQDA